MVCEGSAHTKQLLVHVDLRSRIFLHNLQWTSNRRNTIHASNKTHVSRTTAQRYGNGDDQNGTRKDTSCSYTSDCATNNEGCRVWRNTADEGAEFEDEECDEVYPFDRVVRIELSVDELRRACSQ